VDDRKREVLRAVVDDYVATAEPVGSKTLAARYAFGLSPATLRGEMADLEADGYLRHRYTSAGRIPSDKGYRFYVDRLVATAVPRVDERAQMVAILTRSGAEGQWLLRELSQLLAAATQYATLSLGAPAEGSVRLRQLTTVPVGARRVVLVLVTDRDTVAHRTVDLPDGLAAADCEALVGSLSRNLTGLVLGSLGRTVLQEVYDRTGPFRSVADGILALLEESGEGEAERVMLGGAARLVSQPEFQDADRIRALLDFLDCGEAVGSALSEAAAEQGVSVRIGQENRAEALQEMSLVTAPVRHGDRVVGYVAVLGPTRMPYGRILGIMETLTALGGGIAV
jgi:heat-inducible transcriptional repressor